MHLIQGYIKSCPSIIVRASVIGGTGVHVFFFCSGFGLYLSYLRKPFGFVNFIKRRISKIYFPYIVIVLISSLIPFMFNGDRTQAFLSHIFLYKMFMPRYESSFGNQFWFISTLIQFYVMFIPICRLKVRSKDGFFAITIAVSVFWWIFTGITGLYNERVWGSFFLQYLWEFGLGMVIAQRLEEGNDIKCSREVLLLIAVSGITISTIASLKGGVLNTFNDIFAMLGYLALCLFIYLFRSSLIWQSIIFMSNISYELYLVHVLVFKVLFTVTGVSGKAEYLVGTVAFGIAVVVAHLYHLVIGKMNLLRRENAK